MRSTIILDPGHGGSTPAGKSTPYGAHHASGQHEKVINLELAHRVMGALGGQDVRLTRTDDRNLSLGARAGMARAYGGETRFVSLHSNWGYPSSLGSQTWVHTRASAGSHQLASSIQGEMARLSAGGALGVQAGDLAVLDPGALGYGAAACLVEAQLPIDRIGNPLVPGANQLDAIARAIANGIRSTTYGGRPRLSGARMYGGPEIVVGDDGWRTALDQAIADGATFNVILSGDRLAAFFTDVVTEAKNRGIDLLDIGYSTIKNLLNLAAEAGAQVRATVSDWLKSILPSWLSSVLEAPGSYSESLALPVYAVLIIIAIVAYVLLEVSRRAFGWINEKETREMHERICKSGYSQSVDRDGTSVNKGEVDGKGNVSFDESGRYSLKCTPP
jgi:N-acetylmuramoyl-L-alanine amidase